MKNFVVSFLLVLALCLIAVLPAQAQAATRPVVLTWTAPVPAPSGYNVYSCTVPSGSTSCTPDVTGKPLNSAPLTVTNYTVQETTGVAYGFSITAVYPACTLTSPLTVPCGNSIPVLLNYVPVPPQGQGANNAVIVVP